MEDATAIPTEQALHRLPRWALVAFSARCARRSYARYVEFPLWDWVTEAIESATSAAERVAATGECSHSVHDLSAQAVRAMDALEDSINGPGVGLLELHYAALHAANAAKCALECAVQSTGRVFPANPAGRAAEAARSAEASAAPKIGDRSVEAERAMRQDLNALESASAEEQWTDDTTVPAHFFAVHEDSSGPLLAAIRDLSNELARLVARDPYWLERIEWRDLERMMASVFSRLGFDVQLTPSSKDHGKDLVLECLISGKLATYIVEIKHWRSRQRVGHRTVTDFIRVVARERRQGGLFLATYGYASDAVEAIAEVDRDRIRLGDVSMIVALCRTYLRAENGLWQRTKSLPELIFSDHEDRGTAFL